MSALAASRMAMLRATPENKNSIFGCRGQRQVQANRSNSSRTTAPCAVPWWSHLNKGRSGTVGLCVLRLVNAVAPSCSLSLLIELDGSRISCPRSCTVRLQDISAYSFCISVRSSSAAMQFGCNSDREWCISTAEFLIQPVHTHAGRKLQFLRRKNLCLLQCRRR